MDSPTNKPVVLMFRSWRTAVTFTVELVRVLLFNNKGSVDPVTMELIVKSGDPLATFEPWLRLMLRAPLEFAVPKFNWPPLIVEALAP